MVDAEAVIACAAGAVAEFQPGIVRVGAPADGAFVMIQAFALFLFDFPRRFAEVDGRAGLARLPGNQAQKRAGEEDEEVQNGDDRQEIDREGIGDHGGQEIKRIDQGHVFHLDRDKEEEQNGLVGEERGIGEEHRQVKVLRVDADAQAADEIDQETVKHRQRPADEKIDVELRRTPVLLERAAHPVVEIKDEKGEKTRGGRINHKGEQTPDLTAQNQRCVKAQIAQEHAVGHAENPEDDVRDRQVAHQVRDAEIRMLVTEAVNQPHGVFHRQFLQI